MIIELLKRITSALEQKKINYMLSGSIALNSYAIPRMTLDIDLVIEIDNNNLKGFLSIFDKSFYINPDTVEKEVKTKGMFNAIDHKTGFKIDFIIRKDTEYRRNEFSKRVKTRVADFNVWMVALDDLIISKIEWIQTYQSEKQITDIKNLLANPDIDKNYIINWCNRLNLNTFKLL